MTSTPSWPTKSQTLWFGRADEDDRAKLRSAAVAGLAGIAPEGRVGGHARGQMVAAHSAAMECYRRAMIPDQTFEGRPREPQPSQQALAHLRHPAGGPEPAPGQGPAEGHGRARPRPPGGQAIVGAVEAGGGVAWKIRGNPMHKLLPMHLPALWSQDPEREPVPLAGDAERPLPHARGRVAGRTQG